MEFVAYIAVFLVSFLLGSFPSGVVISKLFYHQDIRDTGSGNIGTTNAMRAMGKVGGSAVFLCDFGKGILSGLLAPFVAMLFITPDAFSLYQGQIAVALSFLGCILGHIFCPWLGFQGGKGIAVGVGCMFVSLGIPFALLEIALFAVLVISTKYVSVGSIAACVLCPVLGAIVFWGNPYAWACTFLAACVAIWAHRENIQRLRDGNENRIGDKKRQS